MKELHNQWVRVTGRVEFLQHARQHGFYTALVITPTEREPLDKLIEVVPPDPNPYVY